MGTTSSSIAVSGAVIVLIALVAACAPVRHASNGEGSHRSVSHLFDATTAIQDRWTHLPLRGSTEYRITTREGRTAIRAIGKRSASGLIRRVDVDPQRCRNVEWSWAVTRLQPGADLREKKREDVAASIFLLFGDPGFLFDPQPVPTLRYVWTNEKVPVDTVIDNPYLPGTVRSIVIRSGADGMGNWIVERRDISSDFRRAFNRDPEAPVQAIVLFTDNDQTGEPVEAYYGFAKALCAS